MEQNRIHAIHHITAIAASAAENVQFYEQVLGLRLVKQTVNFDDPYTYHLYYGDPNGSPGTIITFFPWEGTPAGIQGSGMIAAISFSVPLKALPYWEERLTGSGIEVQTNSRFGEPMLTFRDPHGLPLELIGTPFNPVSGHRGESSIEPGPGLTGFHSATVHLTSLDETRNLLVGTMGMKLDDREEKRYRFKMRDERAPGHFLDIVVDPQARRGQQGTGTVHHIAFRAHTDEEQSAWRRQLLREKFRVTEIIDRKYFRSIYFREPGGVLFEIATDPPGFTVDEPPETLGASLMLPRQYEAIRENIVKRLPPLRLTDE